MAKKYPGYFFLFLHAQIAYYKLGTDTKVHKLLKRQPVKTLTFVDTRQAVKVIFNYADNCFSASWDDC